MNDNILLVDDDLPTIQVLAGIVSGLGQLRFATNGEDALRLAHEQVPSLIILDAEMPGMSGFQVLETLKAEDALADVPVIFVTSRSQSAFAVAGFEIGAADYIAKPVSPTMLRARVRTQLRVKHMADELRRVAAADPLTGLANRRMLDDTLEREWRRARRWGTPLALLAIEVDAFKALQDQGGVELGEACLQRVAQVLTTSSLRPGDLAARSSGSEFALLLPHTPREGAEVVARRLMNAVGEVRTETLAPPAHPGPGALSGAAPGIAAPSPTPPMPRGALSVSVGIGCYDAASACWTSPASYSRLLADVHLQRHAIDLKLAASKALSSARHAGGANAWLLDVAQADRPLIDDGSGSGALHAPGARRL